MENHDNGIYLLSAVLCFFLHFDDSTEVVIKNVVS